MNEKQTSQIKTASVNQPSQLQTVRPTKKQKELLGYIEQFIAEHGYSPSYREIMNGLNYTSVATVALHVGNLIKRGHLIKRDHSARSLEVVNPSAMQPANVQTNQVKDAEEKWLVGKVERLFAEAEAEALPTKHQVEDIGVLLAALRVLGLEGAAQSFVERLSQLRTKTIE
ncbi:hypothetical protein JNM87_00495 [Candidatus Saccharibacteria bacterium]|nr:hypothetical protein [Candidatus Saccharibacteria bacterium]